MAIREGRWDCSSCGSTRIYGRHVDCPGCGRPRPAGVRFYLADGEPIVTDPEQLNEARSGPDWICRQCGATTRAAFATCGGCGAPRADSPTQRVIEYRHAEADARAPLAPEAEWDWFLTLRSLYARPGVRGLLKILAKGAAVCLLLVGIALSIAAYRNRPQIIPARVTEATWTRTIWYRELHAWTGEGWTLPDSAQVLGQERRVQRTERRVVRVDTTWSTVPVYRTVRDGADTVTRTVHDQVRTGSRTYVCGNRDLGNGYFEDIECSEPVYETRTRTVTEVVPRYTSVSAGTEQRMRLREVHGNVPVHGTWYRYRAREWRTGRVSAEGSRDSARAWPALPSDTLRETERHEGFLVVIEDARGETHFRSLYEWEAFARYRQGQPVAMRVGRGSTHQETDVVPRDSLPACRRWHAGRGDPPPDTLGCSPRRRR